MNKVVLAIFAVALCSVASANVEKDKREVCYDKYGCFSTDAPWTSLLRPLSALPKPPYEVQTRYILFTRNTESMGYDLMVDKDVILAASDFSAERKTVFIIHGFTDNHKMNYVWEAKNKFLEHEDVNVICVDWAPGARAPYLAATANARLVGAQTARFLYFLQEKGNLDFEDVHVIGHNLGAHVAGYIGDRTMGQLPRITAIDPSDPYFGDTDPIVRLDTGDAQFVEVIHTNGNGALNLGMGIVSPIGHVDIFPNGGRQQPGCEDLLGTIVGSIIDLITLDFEGAIGIWACSHIRGADFYVESITQANTCPFIGYQCDDYSEFQKGNCYSSCKDSGRCLPMGYNAKNFTGSGKYYLHTGDGKDGTPFCRQSVQIQVPISSSQAHAVGSLWIEFKGTDGIRSEKFYLVDNSDISAGQMLSKWVEVPSSIMHNPSERTSLILHYQRGGLLPINQPRTLALDAVNLLVIDTQFQSQTISYSGITIDFGTDTQIS